MGLTPLLPNSLHHFGMERPLRSYDLRFPAQPIRLNIQAPAIGLHRTLMWRAWHQRRIILERANNLLDRVPPSLLIYATAVRLSHIINTCWFNTCGFNASSALRMASNSNQLIGRIFHPFGHVPDAFRSPICTPHPSLEASEKSVCCAMKGRSDWPFITFVGRAHHHKWTLLLTAIGIC